MKMNAIFAFLFISAVSGISSIGCNTPKEVELVHDPDMFLNVSGLIKSKGYPVEEHTVQTSDGFLLTLLRIAHGRNSHRDYDVHRPVVFLQHGLLSAASDWVINFQNQSLGFILADAGYDVWLGNTRGNTYSRRHVKYTPKMKEFWNFSFDEMASYDLPAMLDYVLNATGEEQLYYVGHSQGTTAAFAMLSENPKYNEKIKLFIALAPVAFTGYINTAIRYLAPFTNDIDVRDVLGEDFPRESGPYSRNFQREPPKTSNSQIDERVQNRTHVRSHLYVCSTENRFICEDVIFLPCGIDKKELNQYLSELLGVNEFLPSNAVMKFLSEFVCSTEEKFICEDVIFFIFGIDKKELNQTRIGVYSAHTPAGSSTRSVVHFAQMVNSQLFCKYDYGEKENMKIYKQAIPPEYDLSLITAPVALIWSLNDDLADPADVNLLQHKLRTLVTSYCVPFAPFNHGDYVLAVDAKKLVYDEILTLLTQH